MGTLLPVDRILDLVDLRLFANIAETNSLTQGARFSHLSVPSASARIKKMEDRIGNPLLQRGARGVSLTPAGECLLRRARSVLRHLDLLGSELQEYSEGNRGHIRIRTVPEAATEYLPAVLSRFLAAHEGVTVELAENLSPDIVAALEDGLADVGIVSGLFTAHHLECIPYRKYRLVLVVPQDHALAGRKSVSFQETLGCDYVSYAKTADRYFSPKGVEEMVGKSQGPRYEGDNFEAICRMIELRTGIGIVPRLLARRFAKTLKIRIVELTDVWAGSNMTICVRNLESLPAYTKDLIELLKADARSADRGVKDSNQRRPVTLIRNR